MFNIGDRVKEITEGDPKQTGVVTTVSADGSKIGVQWDKHTVIGVVDEDGFMWPAADFCHEHETSVVLTTGDADWQGLYIDGLLEYQGHSISADVALQEVAGKGVIVFRTIIYDLDWLDEHGCLPRDLVDVKEAE